MSIIVLEVESSLRRGFLPQISTDFFAVLIHRAAGSTPCEYRRHYRVISHNPVIFLIAEQGTPIGDLGRGRSDERRTTVRLYVRSFHHRLTQIDTD